MEADKINIQVTGIGDKTHATVVHNLIIDERGVEKISVIQESGKVIVEGTFKMNRDQILNAVNLSGVYHAE